MVLFLCSTMVTKTFLQNNGSGQMLKCYLNSESELFILVGTEDEGDYYTGWTTLGITDLDEFILELQELRKLM